MDISFGTNVLRKLKDCGDYLVEVTYLDATTKIGVLRDWM
jgi:hypothetical protein